MAFEFVVPEWDFELQMSTFVLAKPVNGPANVTNFDLVVEEVPQLNIGEVLAYAEWISLDAYVREVNLPEMEIGDPIPGTQIARIVRTRNDDFPVGMLVIGYFGWRNLTVYKPPSTENQNYMTMCHMPDMKGLPVQYALGVMGMPGNTAYWGIVDGCQAETGTNLVVSGAGGSVGSVACQIAKLLGCNVTAFVGSETKLKWLEKNNKVDQAYSYKDLGDLRAAFRDDMFPEGIDCIFDLVGGNFLLQAMRHLNHGGKVVQVGNLSNLKRPIKYGRDIIEPFDAEIVRDRELVIQGFNPKLYLDKGYEGIYKIRDWILSKRLKVVESVTIGFDKTPQVFLDMINGKNLGKQLVRCRFFRPKELKSTFPQAPIAEVVRINKYTRAGRIVEFNNENFAPSGNQAKSIYTKSRFFSKSKNFSQNKSAAATKTLGVDQSKSIGSENSQVQNKGIGLKTIALLKGLGTPKTTDPNMKSQVASKTTDKNKSTQGPAKPLKGKTDQLWGGLASKFRKDD